MKPMKLWSMGAAQLERQPRRAIGSSAVTMYGPDGYRMKLISLHGWWHVRKPNNMGFGPYVNALTTEDDMRIILGALLGVYGTLAFYGDVNPMDHFYAAADAVELGIHMGVEAVAQWQ